MAKNKTTKVLKNSLNTCKDCCAYPCNCSGSGRWTTPAFTFGATLASLYLAATLIAYFLPSFYSYMGFALLRGSIPVSVGDFTGTHILAGIVSWFLVGVVVKGALIWVKSALKNKG